MLNILFPRYNSPPPERPYTEHSVSYADAELSSDILKGLLAIGDIAQIELLSHGAIQHLDTILERWEQNAPDRPALKIASLLFQNPISEEQMAISEPQMAISEQQMAISEQQMAISEQQMARLSAIIAGSTTLKCIRFNNITIPSRDTLTRLIDAFTQNEGLAYIELYSIRLQEEMHVEDTLEDAIEDTLEDAIEDTLEDTIENESENEIENTLEEDSEEPILLEGLLAKTATLKTLTFSCVKKLTLESVKSLARGLDKNTTLNELDISYSSIYNKAFMPLLSALERNKTIKTLYVGGNYIHGKAIEALSNFLAKNPPLTKLSLDHTENLTNIDLKKLSNALIDNYRLMSLDISGRDTDSDTDVPYITGDMNLDETILAQLQNHMARNRKICQAFTGVTLLAKDLQQAVKNFAECMPGFSSYSAGGPNAYGMAALPPAQFHLYPELKRRNLLSHPSSTASAAHAPQESASTSHRWQNQLAAEADSSKKARFS